MRIAVYNNMANNAYIQTRLLRRAGHDAELVLDPLDRFVMSDPRWEDLDLELPAGRLSVDSLPSTTMPDWVHGDALCATGSWRRRRRIMVAAASQLQAVWSGFRAAGPKGAPYVGVYADVIRRLRGYDCAIVYGLGPIVAALARIPFLTEPFGGDITIVPFADGDGWQGQPEPGTRPPDGPQPHIAALQRYGLSRTNRILVADPAFNPYIERLGLARLAVPFGLAVDTDVYSPAPELEIRAQVLNRSDQVLVFVPSRQDWFWKGSNVMLEGFANAARARDDVVLVCAGWGADLDRSRQLIADLRLGDKVRLLDHALSKRRLVRYYRAADIVLDQFTLGSYGTSTLEAMSCAKPVLVYLDTERFRSRFSELPPVVNVRGAHEIAEAINALVDDPIERERIGARSRKWVIANHGASLIDSAVALCAEAIREGPQS